MSNKHSPLHFSTYEQMVLKLRAKGLSIDDKSLAIELLKTRGYYNLINRYKAEFYAPGKSVFPDHTHLTDLFYYHRVEDDLVNILFKFTISFEGRLKEAMAYTLARDFGLTEEEFLQPTNFRNRSKRAKITSFISEQIESCRDNPTAYYKKEYHQVPPWIMLSNLTLGQTRMLFSIFPFKQTAYVTGELLPIHFGHNSWKQNQPRAFVAESLTISELDELKSDAEFNNLVQSRVKELIEMVRNMLTVINTFRNTLAHGNRLIGFHADQKINYKTLRVFVNEKVFTKEEFMAGGLGQSDLFAFMISLVLLTDKFDAAYFIDQLSAWQEVNTSAPESKVAFTKFIKSCGLPIDFVKRLDHIEIEQTRKQKAAYFERWFNR